MSTTRRQFIKTVGAAIATSQIPSEAATVSDPLSQSAPLQRRTSGKKKVIYDQDNSGPFGTDILGTLMMLQADNVDLLGITLVTGDAWLKQEMAFILRLLEMMGRTEIPVYAGAEFPMLNTKEEWELRQQMFGGHRLDPWMGAFNRANGAPDEIKPLPPPYDRFAELKAQQEHAAHFIIKAVRENPGEVTIYAGGPLTNVALAIALAPDIVPLVPSIAIMGTGFHTFTNTFNMSFDPGAARKVLRAGWRQCSVVTVDIAEEIHENDEIAPGRKMIEEIVARADSPISDLFQKHALEPIRRNPKLQLFRMADEMIAAHVIDPGIFTKSEEMYADICTTPGPRYGDSMFWPKNWRGESDAGKLMSAADRRVFVDPRQYYMGPPPSAGVVEVLREIDHDRFKKLFIDLMTKPLRKS